VPIETNKAKIGMGAWNGDTWPIAHVSECHASHRHCSSSCQVHFMLNLDVLKEIHNGQLIPNVVHVYYCSPRAFQLKAFFLPSRHVAQRHQRTRQTTRGGCQPSRLSLLVLLRVLCGSLCPRRACSTRRSTSSRESRGHPSFTPKRSFPETHRLKVSVRPHSHANIQTPPGFDQPCYSLILTPSTTTIKTL
jgi:hypothetical protein